MSFFELILVIFFLYILILAFLLGLGLVVSVVLSARPQNIFKRGRFISVKGEAAVSLYLRTLAGCHVFLLR